MSEQWYAMRSKPKKEFALWGEAVARGFEVFFPRLHVQPVNPRSARIRPYFPGYLFVRLDLPTVGFTALAWIPHSNGLVCFDGQPSPVPDALISAIRRRMDQVSAAGGERLQGLQRGDAVLVEGGPFAGYHAIFDARLSGTERVRVLLKLLGGGEFAAVLPSGQVGRKRSAPASC